MSAHAEDEAFEVVLCLHIYTIYMNVFCHVFAAYKCTIYMNVILRCRSLASRDYGAADVISLDSNLVGTISCIADDGDDVVDEKEKDGPFFWKKINFSNFFFGKI